MLVLDPWVADAVWAVVEPLVPVRGEVFHPLGCHRPRIPDREVFEGILLRLMTGCCWDVAGRLCKGGETVLRTRFNEWNAQGVFEQVVTEAIQGYDRVVGIDLSEASVDTSTHKAPCGVKGQTKALLTGANPGGNGRFWRTVTAISVGWATGAANRHDQQLFTPTLAATTQRGLHLDIETLHLDRGYTGDPVRRTCWSYGTQDIVCAPKQAPANTPQKPKPLGKRWTIEPWLSNFGQHRPQHQSTPRPTRTRHHPNHHHQTHQTSHQPQLTYLRSL